jgi:hypothetical protein
MKQAIEIVMNALTATQIRQFLGCRLGAITSTTTDPVIGPPEIRCLPLSHISHASTILFSWDTDKTWREISVSPAIAFSVSRKEAARTGEWNDPNSIVALPATLRAFFLFTSKELFNAKRF